MIPTLYEDFEMRHPTLYDDAVSIEQNGPFSLLATYSDGSQIEYHSLLETIRTMRKGNDKDSYTEETWKNEFGYKLQRMMADRCFTRYDLSRLTDIAESGISRYTNKSNIPGITKLKSISEALRCEVEDLI